MAELVTYNDIAAELGVGVQTVRKWGRRGDLGEAVIEFPAHFRKSVAMKGARKAQATDLRVKLSDFDVAQMRRRGKAGEALADLAAAFDVHESYVSLILRNKRRVTIHE